MFLIQKKSKERKVGKERNIGKVGNIVQKTGKIRKNQNSFKYLQIGSHGSKWVQHYKSVFHGMNKNTIFCQHRNHILLQKDKLRI